MMSWQLWRPPLAWSASAPPVRWQELRLPGQQAAEHAASVWLFALDDPAFDTPALTACLSGDQQARASRLRQPLHGRRHRVAHSVVRLLLGHLSGLPANALTWQTGPHGKPHLIDDGGRPRLPHFNLSHSGGWALLITSHTLDVGVDLEERRSRQHLSELSERIHSIDEIHATGTEDVLQAWARKEACLKALGTGLTREMPSLTLRGHEVHTASDRFVELGPLPPMAWDDIALPEDCLAQAAWACMLPRQPGQ